jgi:hypothetical protein
MKIDGVLALIAGILGLLGSVIMLFISALATELIDQALGGLVFSTLAIIAAIMCAKKPKAGGIMMLISAIGGFFTVSVFYIVSAILLIIAGVISLRKAKTTLEYNA